MWPFKESKGLVRPTPEAPPRPSPPVWLIEAEKVRAEFPPGRKFEYLGRTMVAVKYSPYQPGADFGRVYIYEKMPSLHCEYADDLGVLHEWFFPQELFAVLLKAVQ